MSTLPVDKVRPYTAALTAAAVVVGVTLFLGASARAATIDYIFGSVGTGSLGATPLANVSFELKLTGDTATVVTGGLPDPFLGIGTAGEGNYYSITGVATFSSGSINATLANATVLLFNDNQGFSFPPASQVLFVQNTAFAGIFTQAKPSVFGSYDLATAFSLISTGSPSLSGSISDVPVIFLTDQGDLSLDITGSITFEARLATVSAETPLPAAFPLFVTGLGALGLLGWRRKRKQIA